MAKYAITLTDNQKDLLTDILKEHFEKNIQGPLDAAYAANDDKATGQLIMAKSMFLPLADAVKNATQKQQPKPKAAQKAKGGPKT